MMEDKMETDVVSQLHQLSSEKKSTLSDTFKDFSLFVNSRDVEIRQDITDILDTFHPSGNVGKLFKVKLVDRYRVSPYVVQLLQSDDTLYIAQALKCSWFFEDIDDVTSFVSTIVPSLSLVTRMKVINKYALHLKNTNVGDVIYQKMKDRYGVKSAFPLLPACSEKFIRNELPNVKITLPPNVTLALYKKYPSLTTEYIKYLADGATRKRTKSCCLNDYESIFVKMSQKDLKSFLTLFESNDSHVPYMRLGRRPTKKLLKNETDKVLGKYQNYSRILVEKTFFTRLSLEQFKKLYVSSMFPDKISEFCLGLRHVVRSLNYVKEDQRSNLILSAFREKYNADMTSDDVLFKLEETWIWYLPEDARHKWLENKVSETTDVTDQARYLARLPVANGMPRLKKLIESQSVPSVRATIVRHLVKTIAMNKCSAGIKDLFAYLSKRFRNEVRPFREAVISEMSEFKAMYLELGADDWTPISDFINIVKLNGEAPLFRNTLRRGVFSYQVESAFAGKADVDLVLKNYLEFEKCDSADLSPEVVGLCYGKPCHRLYLEWLTRETFKMEWSDLSSKVDFVIKLFEDLCQYNKDNAVVLDIPGWIVGMMESELNEKDFHWKKNRILEAIKNYPIPRLQKYIAEEVFPNIMNERLVCRLLTHEPDTVLQYIQQVMEKTLNQGYGKYHVFFKKCRMYDSFRIPSEMVAQCQKILMVSDPKEMESTIMQSNAIRVLALFLQPAEYSKIVTQYVLDGNKIEEYSDEIRALYDIAGAVCKSFVDVSAPLAVLPLVREFTGGDFLKLVVGSLVSTCLKVPENELLSLLKEWIDCPVSLRKHFLRLTYEVAPIDYRVETFVNIFRSEKNISLRLVLFRLLRNSFIDVPSDDTFSTFKSIITQLSVDDDEALKLLINIHRMESDYISPYLELLWQLVDTEWGTVLKDGKSQILNLIYKDVLVVLTEGFCDSLITHELTTKLPLSCPSSLLPMYLLWSPSHDVQMARFDKIATILRPLIINLWDTPSYGGGHVFAIRSVVRGIVSSICDMSKNDSFFVSPIQVLTALKKFLASIIKPHDLLRESLSIDLAVYFHQHRALAETTTFGKGVAQIYKSYIEKLGKDYGYSLVKALLDQVPTDHRLDLASELLSEPKSDPMHHLVGVEILRSECSCEEKDIPKCKALVTELSKCEHPSVQAAASDLFLSLSIVA